MANLSVEEPDALMRARPGLREPWRVTARATQPDARNTLDLSPFPDWSAVENRSVLPGARTGRRLGAPATRCRGSAGRWGLARRFLPPPAVSLMSARLGTACHFSRVVAARLVVVTVRVVIPAAVIVVAVVVVPVAGRPFV